MKIATKLAAVFKTVAEQGTQLESTASAILGLVKQADATGDVKVFDALVSEAYAANGWRDSPGRPPNGTEKKGSAPNTVRTYVAVVRAAIRAGIRIGHYDTFTALRAALERKTRPANSRQQSQRATSTNGHVPKDVSEDFTGIAVEEYADMNGALFHDLAVTFIHLPRDQRSLFGRQLAKLLHTWQGRANLKTPRAEREPVKKAA